MRGNLWSINLLQLEDIVWSGKENDYQAMQITFSLHIRNFYNFLLTSISLSSTFPHHSETMEFLLCEYRSRRPSTGGKSLVNILNCCCCCYRMKSESIFNSLHTWAIFDSTAERKTLHEIWIVCRYVDKTDEIMKSIRSGNSLQKYDTIIFVIIIYTDSNVVRWILFLLLFYQTNTVSQCCFIIYTSNVS